jgi:hypothetical protein
MAGTNGYTCTQYVQGTETKNQSVSLSLVFSCFLSRCVLRVVPLGACALSSVLFRPFVWFRLVGARSVVLFPSAVEFATSHGGGSGRARAASREVGGTSMGTGSSKVQPDTTHKWQSARSATAAFRASVDPTARPTARHDSAGPSWQEEFQLDGCVVCRDQEGGHHPTAGDTIEIRRALRVGAQVKIRAAAGDEVPSVGSVMAFSLLRTKVVVKLDRSSGGGVGGGGGGDGGDGGGGGGGGGGTAHGGLPQDSMALVDLADCEVLLADDQPSVLAGVVTKDGRLEWAGDGTAQRWLRAEDWGVGAPSAGSVVAQLTSPHATTAQPARSVRVDMTRGRVVSGIAVGARLLFDMWGQARRSGTVVASDQGAGKVTVRVDNSDVTETFESAAVVPVWCAGGVVAKGVRVGFMTAADGSDDGADHNAHDDRTHRHARCGTVMGFKTTGESAEEFVVIRADDDGTEQLFAVHSLVPSSRTEQLGEEGGMAAGAVAVGIVPGTIAVAPLSTFVGETAASGRRVWTIGGSELAGDLNEFNFAAGPLSAAEFVDLRDKYCEDVTTKRDRVRWSSVRRYHGTMTTTDNNNNNDPNTYGATATTTTSPRNYERHDRHQPREHHPTQRPRTIPTTTTTTTATTNIFYSPPQPQRHQPVSLENHAIANTIFPHSSPPHDEQCHHHLHRHHITKTNRTTRHLLPSSPQHEQP